MKIYRDLHSRAYQTDKGTNIELDGNELAHAIDSYLYAIGVKVQGPRTIRIITNEGVKELCTGVYVYVDPEGRVLREGEEIK